MKRTLHVWAALVYLAFLPGCGDKAAPSPSAEALKEGENTPLKPTSPIEMNVREIKADANEEFMKSMADMKPDKKVQQIKTLAAVKSTRIKLRKSWEELQNDPNPEVAAAAKEALEKK